MDNYLQTVPYFMEWMDMFQTTDMFGWVEVEILAEDKVNYLLFTKSETNHFEFKHEKRPFSSRGRSHMLLKVCVKGSSSDEDVDEIEIINKMRETKRRYPHVRVNIQFPHMTDEEMDDTENDLNNTESIFQT